MLNRVTCSTCSSELLVEKYSPEHTSIQWAGPSRKCPELAAQGEVGSGTMNRICATLRRRIDELASDGRIPISVRSYPVPGRVDQVM